MKAFQLPSDLQSVVCLGAHPDDIEIGAGGTIAAIGLAKPEALFTFIVLSADHRRATEAVASAEALLGERVEVHIGDFEDGYLPYRDSAGVKDYLKAVLPSHADLVIGPHHDDGHQDHRFASELLGELCRKQPILGYEIIKYDGDLGQPSVFFPSTAAHCEKKVATIVESFDSQKGKHWFDEEAISALMRIRGVESDSQSRYAEAFYGRKMVIQ